MYKFILAVGGYFLFRGSFFGAILGFLIGSGIDNYQNLKAQFRAQGGANGAGGRAFSPEDLFNYYQQRSQTNDVPTMLMALSAAVMKADGKVLKAELNYVKSFFAQQFGPQFNSQHLQTLKQFLDSGSIPLDKICQDIRMRMQPKFAFNSYIIFLELLKLTEMFHLRKLMLFNAFLRWWGFSLQISKVWRICSTVT